LAGFIALLIWTLVTSIALLYGVAIAAQLEAVRAGVPSPRRTTAADGTSREGSGSEAQVRPSAVAAS
jgi:uncharacterized BrkB/YihY/UPF0761 family membrane protein